MAWSLLQSFATDNVGSAVINQAPSSDLTAGSKLIAWCATNGTSGTVTYSIADDSNGNDFTQVGQDVYNPTGSDNISLTVFVLDTPAGDAGTKPVFRFNASATASNISVLLEEVSGLKAGTTGSLDGSVAFATGTLAAAGNTASPSYSSAGSNEYLVTVFGDGYTSSNLPTIPAGWTADPNDNPGGGNDPNLILAYKNSTGGAESAVWAVPAADHYVVAMVAFQLVGGIPNTSAPSLTVTPAFSIKKAEAHLEALTVTPAFHVVKAEAHKQAATITPMFSAQGVKNFGKGGGASRQHRRPWWP